MEKVTGRSIIATALAVVLSIGVFSTLFIGANSIVLAAANNREASVPATTAQVSTAVRENVAPEGYQAPSITVVEDNTRSMADRSANSLTAEEAAALAAQYIWDVFDESIDDATVEIYYMSFPSSTRPYWFGNVITGTGMQMLQMPVIDEDGNYVLDEKGYVRMEDYREIEVQIFSFYFTIDAVTGERVSIHRDMSTELNVIDFDLAPPITQEDVDAENERLRILSDQYLPHVREVAQKHFNNTKVESVEFALGFGRFYGMPQILFIAIDETGREANIVFNVNSEQVISLCTQGNDIVPGYDFGWTIGEIHF